MSHVYDASMFQRCIFDCWMCLHCLVSKEYAEQSHVSLRRSPARMGNAVSPSRTYLTELSTSVGGKQQSSKVRRMFVVHHTPPHSTYSWVSVSRFKPTEQPMVPPQPLEMTPCTELLTVATVAETLHLGKKRFNQIAMASTQVAIASNLEAIASNLISMASNLEAMTSNLLAVTSDGLQP